MSSTGREPIRVLHVDDDPDLAETAALFLEEEHDRFEVVTETSADDGLHRLAAADVDCVVSDYDMPGKDGLDFLEAVRSAHSDLPFVLFTGKGSEEIASEAISAGVTEYLQKGTGTDQYTVLANRIERAVAENRAKQALEESERMFSTLVSNLPGMVYRACNEPDWPMEFVSDGCRDLTGYDPELLEDGSVRWGPDVLHEDDAGTMWDDVQAALDAREPFEVTYRIRTADDEVKWVWEQGRGVYDGDDLVALEGFITDITERKRAQRSRRKYERIVETMDDAAFILDIDGEFEFVNDAFLEATGFDRETVVGAGTGLFADQTDTGTHAEFERLIDELGRGDRSRASIEYDQVVDDTTRTIDLRLVRFEDDEAFGGIIGVARDVTTRRERERELERYRTLVETVGDPMYVADESGYLEMVNEAFVEHAEYSRERIEGTHMTEAMDDVDFERGSAILHDLVASDERDWGRFEFSLGLDGETRRYETNMTPLVADDGTLDGSVGVIREVTERKERELELRQYRTIMQAAGDPVYALDDRGHLTMVNEAMADVVGADSTDEVTGTHVSDLLVSETVERGREEIRALLDDDRDRAIFEASATPDDRVFEIDIALLTDRSGRLEGTVGVLRDITEHKERERELERYELLVENVGDPMYALEPDGTISMANEAMADHLDCPREEIVGEPVSTFMPAEDVETGSGLVADLVADDDRKWATFEMEAIAPDGERTINEDKIGVLTDGDGNYTGSVGVIRDISERKERERELERYETIIQAVGDPVYALDGDGDITFINDAIEDLTGRSPDELVGKHISEIIDDEDAARGRELNRELLRSDCSNATFEMDLLAETGERTINEDKIGVLTDGDGNYTGSVGVIRDISERKERERELERYETIIQAVGDPVYALDGDGDITFINDAIEDLTGRSPDELVGKHISEIIDDEDAARGRELNRELLRSDCSNATFEMDLLAETGERTPCENHMALLPFDEDGNFRGTAGVVRDITERKQRERRLEQFASVVSHDLRNPLNVIEGRIEMARETGDGSNLDHALDSVSRMRRLVEDLLTLAREGRAVSETEPTDLAGVADSAWRGVDTVDATLVLNDPGTVVADGDRLQALFENLYRNAVEHGGRDVTVTVDSLADDAGFYVADDGPGVPPEQRDRILEHGYSTSREGTGFGLSIVENIVSAHDWELTITESEDGGARFEIVV
jgi:PAS domain S-box-containing protein